MENEAKTGLSFIEALQLVFIVLKLCGVIKWSWWLVLTPLWASLVFLLIMLAVIFIKTR